MNGHSRPIILPGAARPEDNDPLSRDLLAMAAAWAGVNVRGLSLHDARQRIRYEIEKLRGIRAGMEAGL